MKENYQVSQTAAGFKIGSGALNRNAAATSSHPSHTAKPHKSPTLLPCTLNPKAL